MEQPSHRRISATSATTRRHALGQLLVLLPGVDADGLPDAATRHAVRGGVGVLHGLQEMLPSAAARYHHAIQAEAAASDLPPVLIGANLECGVSYTLGYGCTDVPYPMGVGWSGSVEVSADAASIVAREARAIGFHWTFSPCIDVLRSADDPVIGVRGYGSDPAEVGALGAAFIRATQASNVIATAKHFPGHGDSATDSHLALPVITRSGHDHESVHLPPFRAAVDAGVASIMTAHVALPALGLDEPASLSQRVTQDWLRRDLGFEGIIITDALLMKAVSSRMSIEEACHAGLVAGADVLDAKVEASGFDGLVDRLERTLDAGAVSPIQVDESVARLAAVRTRFGIAHDQIDLEAAASLDQARVWAHPARSLTARGSGGPMLSLSGVREIVLATDTPEAQLVARLLRARTGLTITVSGVSAIDPSRHRPQCLVIGVVRPPLPLTPDALEGLSRMCQSDGLDALLATRPIPALHGVTIPVVCAPVIDLFERPTSAAVAAALDVLVSSPG